MNRDGDRYFPYRRWGLVRNPFGTLTDREWEAAAVLPTAVVAAVEGGEAHVELIGPPGAGKTTALRGLLRHLRPRGMRLAYEYLPAGARSLRTDLRGIDLFLLDEAQRLGPMARRRLMVRLRAAPPLRLIFSTHREWGDAFARAGLPLVRIDLAVRDPEWLLACLERRVALAAETDRSPPRFTLAAAAWLDARFGTDRRAIECFLYEFFQSAPSATPIDATALAAFAAEMA